MDITTVLGLVLGFGSLVAAVLLEGGSLSALLNVPGLLIVFGGTFGATLVSFPMKTFAGLPKLIGLAFKGGPAAPEGLIQFFAETANKARREGLLSLEKNLGEVQDGFLRRGLTMVVDGIDPSIVREILETDAHKTHQRHADGYAMLEAMGGYAPTMGILGAVIGLINVLSHLDKPENLGHSIAVAFVATLYGVAAANLLWLPLASKLKIKSAAEQFASELKLEGVLSVQAGHNPHIVRERLKAFVPPGAREQEEPAPAAAEPTPAAAPSGEPAGEAA